MKTRLLLSLSVLAALLSGSPALADTQVISGSITGIEHWVRTNEYVLDKLVYVQEGAELHIEA